MRDLISKTYDWRRWTSANHFASGVYWLTGYGCIWGRWLEHRRYFVDQWRAI